MHDIADEAYNAIIMAMKKNTSLVVLHMYSNPISGECAQLIVQALQHNNTLQLYYALIFIILMMLRGRSDLYKKKLIRKEKLMDVK